MTIRTPKAGADWEPDYKLIHPYKGGMNVHRPFDLLQEEETPNILNIIDDRDAITVDFGYKKFGQKLVGSPQKVFTFKKKNGIAFTVCITTSTLYYFSSGVSQWLLPTNGTSTTLTAAVASGNVFPVTSVSGLAVGQLVGVTLSDGTQLQSTITLIASLNVTLAASIPAGRTAGNTAVFVVAPSFTGSVNTPVSVDVATDNDWLVFTNGVNNVQFFDGANVQPLANLAAIAVTAAWLRVWNRHLFIFGPLEGGNSLPQRVRRSANTDITNWTTLNSGFDDLTETSDNIQAATTIGPYLIVYRDKNIMRGTYTGDANQLVFWEYTVRNTGIPAGGCVVSTGPSHNDETGSAGNFDYLFSTSGIFQYYGGYDVTPIGGQIFDLALGPTGNINNSQVSKISTYYDAGIDEFWIIYPETGDITPKTILRYTAKHRIWRRRRLANGMLSLGPFQTSSSLSWIQDNTRWIDKIIPWNASIAQISAPNILMASPDTQQVYSYDFITSTDDGAVIPWYYWTKEYSLTDYLMTFDGFIAYGQGTGILVECSNNQGRTWQTVGTLNFGSFFLQTRIDRQITANSFIFRFSGTDASFRLSWYSIKFIDAAEW